MAVSDWEGQEPFREEVVDCFSGLWNGWDEGRCEGEFVYHAAWEGHGGDCFAEGEVDPGSGCVGEAADEYYVWRAGWEDLLCDGSGAAADGEFPGGVCGAVRGGVPGAPEGYAVTMSRETTALLEAFEALPEDEKRQFTVAFLRRSVPYDSGPLDDEEPGQAADALFAFLDEDEQAVH